MAILSQTQSYTIAVKQYIAQLVAILSKTRSYTMGGKVVIHHGRKSCRARIDGCLDTLKTDFIFRAPAEIRTADPGIYANLSNIGKLQGVVGHILQNFKFHMIQRHSPGPKNRQKVDDKLRPMTHAALRPQ